MSGIGNVNPLVDYVQKHMQSDPNLESERMRYEGASRNKGVQALTTELKGFLRKYFKEEIEHGKGRGTYECLTTAQKYLKEVSEILKAENLRGIPLEKVDNVKGYLELMLKVNSAIKQIKEKKVKKKQSDELLITVKDKTKKVTFGIKNHFLKNKKGSGSDTKNAGELENSETGHNYENFKNYEEKISEAIQILTNTKETKGIEKVKEMIEGTVEVYGENEEVNEKEKCYLKVLATTQDQKTCVIYYDNTGKRLKKTRYLIDTNKKIFYPATVKEEGKFVPIERADPLSLEQFYDKINSLPNNEEKVPNFLDKFQAFISKSGEVKTLDKGEYSVSPNSLSNEIDIGKRSAGQMVVVPPVKGRKGDFGLAIGTAGFPLLFDVVIEGDKLQVVGAGKDGKEFPTLAMLRDHLMMTHLLPYIKFDLAKRDDFQAVREIGVDSKVLAVISKCYGKEGEFTFTFRTHWDDSKEEFNYQAFNFKKMEGKEGYNFVGTEVSETVSKIYKKLAGKENLRISDLYLVLSRAYEHENWHSL